MSGITAEELARLINRASGDAYVAAGVVGRFDWATFDEMSDSTRAASLDVANRVLSALRARGLLAESAPTGKSRIPQVGDAVHYVSYGTPGGEYASTCRAAVVTSVGEPLAYPTGPGRGADDAQLADLCVFNPSGLFFNTGLPQDERPAHERGGDTWHWAEREGGC